MLIEGHWSHGAQAQSPALAVGTTCAWNVFFGRFLLRLSRIKRPQVMSMVKLSPIALNFGYDFVLLVHFFGTPCTSAQRRPHISSAGQEHGADVAIRSPTKQVRLSQVLVRKIT